MMGREKEVEEMANILWHIPDNYFFRTQKEIRRWTMMIFAVI